MGKRTVCAACGAERGDPDQRGLRCYESDDGLHQWSPDPRKFMELGIALEIVHGMAKRAYEGTRYTVIAVQNEAKLALDTVEDFIVNKSEED